MTRRAIIDRTIRVINELSESEAEKIADFADFVGEQHEEQLLTKGIHKLSAESLAFGFLHNEEDIYSYSDAKQVRP